MVVAESSRANDRTTSNAEHAKSGRRANVGHFLSSRLFFCRVVLLACPLPRPSAPVIDRSRRRPRFARAAPSSSWLSPSSPSLSSLVVGRRCREQASSGHFSVVVVSTTRSPIPIVSGRRARNEWHEGDDDDECQPADRPTDEQTNARASWSTKKRRADRPTGR